jgi:hypothetical protein
LAGVESKNKAIIARFDIGEVLPLEYIATTMIVEKITGKRASD